MLHPEPTERKESERRNLPESRHNDVRWATSYVLVKLTQILRKGRSRGLSTCAVWWDFGWDSPRLGGRRENKSCFLFEHDEWQRARRSSLRDGGIWRTDEQFGYSLRSTMAGVPMDRALVVQEVSRRRRFDVFVLL